MENDVDTQKARPKISQGNTKFLSRNSTYDGTSGIKGTVRLKDQFNSIHASSLKKRVEALNVKISEWKIEDISHPYGFLKTHESKKVCTSVFIRGN